MRFLIWNGRVGVLRSTDWRKRSLHWFTIRQVNISRQLWVSGASMCLRVSARNALSTAGDRTEEPKPAS
jgi:hypothetical protein